MDPKLECGGVRVSALHQSSDVGAGSEYKISVSPVSKDAVSLCVEDRLISGFLFEYKHRFFLNFFQDKYDPENPSYILVATLAKRVLDLYWEQQWKFGRGMRPRVYVTETVAGMAKNFLDLRVEETWKSYVDVLSEKFSKTYDGEPSNIMGFLDATTSGVQTGKFNHSLHSPLLFNSPAFRAVRADVRIGIPNEVHNHGDFLPFVWPRASNFASARSSSHSVFAQNGSYPSSIALRDMRTDLRIHISDEVRNHGVLMPNVGLPASHSVSASSSPGYVFAEDGSSLSSILLQDLPLSPHFDQTSTAKATTSDTLRDVLASIDSEVARGSDMYNHDRDHSARRNDRDHSARRRTPARRARKAKLLDVLNATMAAVSGGATFTLIPSLSADSPYYRVCSAAAGFGCLCSLLGIVFQKKRELARTLAKLGAIGTVSAVNIALGIVVLKGTNWYIHAAVTSIICLLTTVFITMANI